MSIKPPEAGCLIFEILMRQLKSPSAPGHGTFSIFTWAKSLGLVRYPEMLPLSLCVCPLPVYIAMAQAGNDFQQRNGLSSALFKDTFTFRFMTLCFVLFYPVSAHSRGPLCDIQLLLRFTEVSQLCSLNRLHQHFISTLGAKIVIPNLKQINCKTDPGETPANRWAPASSTVQCHFPISHFLTFDMVPSSNSVFSCWSDKVTPWDCIHFFSI